MTSSLRGRIIFVGSDDVHRSPAGTSAYVAAKSLQLGLARVWAHELGADGITVNTVAPGCIPVERHEGVPAGERTAYEQTVALRRMGTPEDVAGAVSYLASPHAAFVTGAHLTVNGGTTVL